MLLPYGRTPYSLDLTGHEAIVVEAGALPSPAAIDALLAQALDAPIGRPRVEATVRPGDCVTVIVSDATRSEPRAAFLAALRSRMPGVRWTLAIATGTHGPSRLESLAIPEHLISDMVVVNHDGHSDRDLIDLGVTNRGTPVQLHRCVLEADLVIATGCIRPHYFAGFGAGVKAIFPGLGGAAAIRMNHRMKLEPAARAGIVEGNPCRDDLEAAVRLVPTPTFLLDGVVGPDDQPHAAVAGDPVLAFRVGAALARPWFTVRAPRSSLVIASDGLPISASLYQAAKIAAATAPLVAPGGMLVVVAECADGVEPLLIVNDAIFRTGILPRLPLGARLGLVSMLPPHEVARTLLKPVDSIEDLLHKADSIVVVPRASQLICEAAS